MSRTAAEIEREYGPFPEFGRVHGVSFDGERVWLATGEKLHALDPESGQLTRELEVPCDAGTAFDGTHLYQIAAGCIHKLDPRTGQILSSIPAPAATNTSGLAWAEGSLYAGHYGDRRILQIDPETGKVLRTIMSDRFVTGVTFCEGQLWHATLEDGQSELRHVDPTTSEVLDSVELPPGVAVSGLESDGKERFFCGGAASGKVRVVKRPKRSA